MLKKLRDTHVRAASLVAAGVVLLGLVLLPARSGVVIERQEGEATILLAADSAVVALPGDCLTVRWRLENIQAVLVNGQPQVGEGQQSICVDAQTLPTLRVILRDGSQRDYTLSVTILLIHPAFWLGLALVVSGTLALRQPMAGALRAGGRQLSRSLFLRRLPKQLAIVALSVLFTCLLLEAGLRFYFTRYGTQEDRVKYVYTLDEIRQLNSVLIPAPYVNYLPSPGYPEHNSLGYRGPEIAIPKPSGVYRIVALGGSTTYSSATSSADSYPAQLQNILRDDYNYPNVEVINGGFIGYTTWETLVNLAFRVLELEPDMILLYEGVNDIIPREQVPVDCYRGHNALRGLNATKGFWVERDMALSPSVLYRFAAVNLGWMLNPMTLNSWFELPRAPCQVDALPVEERVAQNPPVYFERNLRNILALALVNDVQPVLSTWAYYIKQDRPDYWRKAVDEHNAIIKRLAAELDVPLIDLANSLPVNANYWGNDGIHMLPPGTQEQAREYAEFLVASGLLPKTEHP